MTTPKFLTAYLVATTALWLIVHVSGNCWMWQNEHSMFDIARRDGCLDIWFAPSVGMVILQCACLALVTFSPRSTLSRWPRG